MTFLQSVTGLVELQATSGDMERLLSLCQEQGITLFDIRWEDCLTASFSVSRSDLKRLQRLCRKRGDNLKILRRRGLCWPFFRLLHRPILLWGLTCILLFFLLLPTRILFIQLEGNDRIPANQILEAAEDCGLKFGVSRKKLRSEVIKNTLLEKLPGLSWAGVNTRGCRAVLTVAERRQARGPESFQGQNSGIYAVCDGIIESCTARRGTLLCSPGQAVTKGQLLLSGYTDHGSKLLSGPAEGDIFARTRRQICAVLPKNHLTRGPQRDQKRTFSLILGKKRINFPFNSGIWDTGCGRMYEEYHVTLPGGYVLPISLAVNRYSIAETKASSRLPGSGEAALSSFGKTYLNQQMISGEIRSSKMTCKESQDLSILKGEFLCREMIGRRRQGKIGE